MNLLSVFFPSTCYAHVPSPVTRLELVYVPDFITLSVDFIYCWFPNIYADNSCDNQIKVTGNIHKKISSKELPDSEHGQPAHPIVKLDGSEGTPCAEALSSGASAAVTPSVTVTLASYISSSSTLTEMVPPKRASSNRTTKVNDWYGYWGLLGIVWNLNVIKWFLFSIHIYFL